jgi:hypothetical protein
VIAASGSTVVRPPGELESLRADVDELRRLVDEIRRELGMTDPSDET